MATAMLLAFVLAWVAPVQSCFAGASCPGCASPYSCDTGQCGTTVSGSCAVAVVPAAAAAAPSLDKALPPPASLDAAFVPLIRTSYRPAPLADPPPPTSLPSVNIRFCTFQN